MKSRQKGKKKGGSKERVFGCDLQEHLQHSGQEGKEAAASCWAAGGPEGPPGRWLGADEQARWKAASRGGRQLRVTPGDRRGRLRGRRQALGSE